MAEIYLISSDCMSCGVCEFMCPEGAIVQAPNQFNIAKRACTGCALCVPYCVIGAIVPKAAFAERQQYTVATRLAKVLR